jgi:hypothetical protein
LKKVQYIFCPSVATQTALHPPRLFFVHEYFAIFTPLAFTVKAQLITALAAALFLELGTLGAARAVALVLEVLELTRFVVETLLADAIMHFPFTLDAPGAHALFLVLPAV